MMRKSSLDPLQNHVQVSMLKVALEYLQELLQCWLDVIELSNVSVQVAMVENFDESLKLPQQQSSWIENSAPSQESETVSDETMVEIVPKPYDHLQELLQVPENEMSCEATKEHVKHKELLQKTLQDACQIHTEELLNEDL